MQLRESETSLYFSTPKNEVLIKNNIVCYIYLTENYLTPKTDKE